MAKCQLCREELPTISSFLSLCARCIEKDFPRALPLIKKAHRKSREDFGLPIEPPKSSGGKACHLCINQCQMGASEQSFCGLRQNRQGKIVGFNGKVANLSYYFDPLPTNCVADWVCPAGSECGFPQFSYTKGPEYGYKNLAVFYHGCSFNCLFCQNWHFREGLAQPSLVTAEKLASAVDKHTACICYFGGDPSCQLPHSLLTSQLALKKKKSKILRICWETNGSMNPKLLEPMAKIALETGGCIKFDLKAFSEKLNIALCGVSNRQTLANFATLAKISKKRPNPPLLIASTLLIPGYVETKEVALIAQFIAQLNPKIPYSLLAFYPTFYFNDLPTTSRKLAESCYQAAKKAGLKKVHLGNVRLLRE